VLKRKGIGLMQGVEVTTPVGEVTENAMNNGLLVISAKGNVIRFVPPLIITKAQVDEMIEKLIKAL
jgi:acetylornithine/N-succinyldiaminopimelate aminotransferase